MVLFPPPFYFVFDISNLLSYIQNNFSYELARPIMGTIFLVGERAKRARHSQVCSIENRGYIYLEKWFPLWGERGHSLKLFCMYDKRFEI